ncbi:MULTISPECIES: hypothetical protein [unclassified Bradyrhizobium]|uniref:hypothetical protein n=1 Tax=unclassified Bradyrhizobium TaxID=2631580 RepID=UPI0012EBD0AC|nr:MULTISPECIES: hypothetical protein [unclassified Bradyrhizobium]QIG93019.1 hypothetical protein G6P99_11290 [Bradyrhizobium sp. 6(2017)]
MKVSLERFQAKWTPVRVKKTRQNDNPALSVLINQNRSSGQDDLGTATDVVSSNRSH